MASLTFDEIKEKTLKLHSEFAKHEKKPWGPEACVMELQKQLGELAKYVMSIENYYIKHRDKLEEYKTTKEKLGDEMSDILFILIRLANHYGVDLEKEYLNQIDLAYKWFEENKDLAE